MSDTQVSYNGIGLSGAIFIVFLTLKLVGVITWSWLWVTAPLWGGLVFIFAILCIIAVVVGVGTSGGHVTAFFRRRKALKALYQHELPKGR